MWELELDATIENLDTVMDFVNQHLEEAETSMKLQMQIDVAVEELFVNIAHYAYGDAVGKAKLMLSIEGEPKIFSLTFCDRGIPYDPLAKADPDVTLSAEEREIGGLGIFLVKKSMDDMIYEYRDECNILTIKKALV